MKVGLLKLCGLFGGEECMGMEGERGLELLGGVMSRAFLGLDMSSTRLARLGKTVAVLLVEVGGCLCWGEVLRLEDDRELVALLTDFPYVLCGVDAPLSLPPCVLCCRCACDCAYTRWGRELGYLEEDVYHYRMCDLVIRRAFSHISPKPALSNGGPVDITPLTLRWLRLARTLVGAGAPMDKIIEVYATGAIQLYACFFGLDEGRHFAYRGSEERRRSLICEISREGSLYLPEDVHEMLVSSEDVFDALFAALTTWHAFYGRTYTPDMLLSLSGKGKDNRRLSSLSSESREGLSAYLSVRQWSFLPKLGEGVL